MSFFEANFQAVIISIAISVFLLLNSLTNKKRDIVIVIISIIYLIFFIVKPYRECNIDLGVFFGMIFFTAIPTAIFCTSIVATLKKEKPDKIKIMIKSYIIDAICICITIITCIYLIQSYMYEDKILDECEMFVEFNDNEWRSIHWSSYQR